MPPRAKSVPKARAKSVPKAKAKPEPKPKAKAAAGPDLEVERKEALLRECLEQPDIARTDKRVLEIAIGEAKILDGVDAALLERATARLQEVMLFEEALQKKAEELRGRRAEGLARHAGEQEAFESALAARVELQKISEALFDAVGDGDVAGVRRQLDAGAGEDGGAPPLPVDVEDHEGNTPLSEAACYGELEVVELLAGERRAHLDARNAQGRTPLWRAVYNGHEEVVEALLRRGADPTIENADGEPPGKFGTAGTKALISEWDSGKTVEARRGLSGLQLLAYPWPHLLLSACRENEVTKVAEILAAISAEMDRSGPLLRTVIDSENMTDALWTACSVGNEQVCLALLEAGADVDSCSVTGLTCLMIACRKGYDPIVSLLLRYNPKTYLRSSNSRLASDYARELGGGKGDQMFNVLAEHCRKNEDWTTMESDAARSQGNKICSAEGVDFGGGLSRDVGGGGGGAAAARATAELRGMGAGELGGDRYKELLEQRALADVLGIG